MICPHIPAMKTFGAAAAMMSISALGGCSTTTDDTNPARSSASSNVSQQSLTSVSNTTEPPPAVDFPDLSSFTESIGQFDQVNVPRVQGFYFSTPSGLICGSNAYPDLQFEYVGCRGPVPSQGPGNWSVRARHSESATIESIDGDPGFEVDRQSPPSVLPPMHKVTAAKGDAVCGVADEGTVACRLGEHGFVITPRSTELF